MVGLSDGLLMEGKGNGKIKDDVLVSRWMAGPFSVRWEVLERTSLWKRFGC